METFFAHCMSQCGKLLGDGEKDSEQQHRVAHVFLFLERFQLDSGFRELFLENPSKALVEAGLDLSEEDAVQCLKISPYSIYQEGSQISQSVCEYNSYLGEKLQRVADMRDSFAVACNPALERFRKRQINRCWHQMGSSNSGRVHVPVIFELSDGCSVGCPFCGVASEKLKSVFRDTPENKRLFLDVLNICGDIIGEATGEATLYYACEPLDNPDYEIFADMFFQRFGKYPQITTAAAMRNPDRVRDILRKNMCLKSPTIHRFSILTSDIYREIINYFTPEELLYVELLGKYSEAKSTVILNSGRAFKNKSSDDEYADSICCVSGFVVNMARQTLRLLTACPTDNRHPCGEIVYEETGFSDADDFSEKLMSMIRRYMPLSMPMNVPFGIYHNLKIQCDKESVSLKGRDEYCYHIHQAGISINIIEKMFHMLETGTYSCHQILQDISGDSKDEALSWLTLLRKLYDDGIIAPVEEIER
jgi:radical SAM family RiPP maturation amino acid epimerase